MLGDQVHTKKTYGSLGQLVRHQLPHSLSIEEFAWSTNNVNVVQGSAKQRLRIFIVPSLTVGWAARKGRRLAQNKITGYLSFVRSSRVGGGVGGHS